MLFHNFSLTLISLIDILGTNSFTNAYLTDSFSENCLFCPLVLSNATWTATK